MLAIWLVIFGERSNDDKFCIAEGSSVVPIYLSFVTFLTSLALSGFFDNAKVVFLEEQEEFSTIFIAHGDTKADRKVDEQNEHAKSHDLN